MTQPQFRYQISVPMDVHTQIAAAARAALVSEGQYIEALFARFSLPQIGGVKIVSPTGECDAMGRLTGRIEAVEPGQEKQKIRAKEIKKIPGPDPVESLKPRPQCRVIYRYLCDLSQGKKITIKQTEIAKNTGIGAPGVSAYIKELVRVGLIFYGRGWDGTKHGPKYTAPFRKGYDATALDDAGDIAEKEPENFIRNATILPESDLKALKLDPQTIWAYQCLCTLSDGKRIEITLDDLAQKSGIKRSSLRQRIGSLKKHALIFYHNRPLDQPCVFVAPYVRLESGAGA